MAPAVVYLALTPAGTILGVFRTKRAAQARVRDFCAQAAVADREAGTRRHPDVPAALVRAFEVE